MYLTILRGKNWTDLVWFNTFAQETTEDDLTLRLVGSSTVHRVSVARDLGVMLDGELSMKQHATQVASSCFYHLRRLKQIRRVVGKYVTAQLLSAFILYRLDYCNALLAGLPRATTDPLQRIQTAAARLVLNLRLRDHVTPALKQIHWLPVVIRIKFKLCLFMHLIHLSRAPQYLADCVQSTPVVINTWDRLIQQTTLNALQELGSASVASATVAQLHGTPYHPIFVQSLTLTPLNGT